MNIKNGFYLKIAGFVLKIVFVKGTEFNYKYVAEIKKHILSLFGPFVLHKKTKKVDYSIKFISQEDSEEGIEEKQSIVIKNNRYIKLFSENKKQKEVTSPYSLAFTNLGLIIKFIFVKLLKKNHSFYIHTSAALLNKKTALLFLGKSGAGKSTILKLVQNELTPICDDMGFIKKEKNTYYLYETPYQEKNQYPKDNGRFNIGLIFIIKKSHYFKIEKVPNANLPQIVKTMMDQTVINKNKQDIFDFIVKHRKDFYYLYFSNKDENLVKKLLAFNFN